jgi:hypothetical protein
MTKRLNPSVATLLFVAVTFSGCATEPDDTSTAPNSAPSLSAAYISPNTATVLDTLTCTWSGFEDADNDIDQSTVAWNVGKSQLAEGNTLSGGFQKGEVVSCTVTPFDGTDTGATISTEITIDNSVPSLALATITPSNPAADDTLSCSWAGFEDADNDKDLSEITWAINGINAGKGTTFAGAFGGDDTVTCYVTPFDGTDKGADVSDSVTIGNVAPTIGSVTITPDPATAIDQLTCAWQNFVDADSDPDQSASVWSINGEVVGSGLSLNTGYIGGDAVSCTVTPFDGVTSGVPVTHTLTVSNAVPTVSSVWISPTIPSASDTLTCNWSGFEDDDSDPDESKVLWSVNGVAMASGTTLTGAFSRDDTVGCAVTPFDGFDQGIAVSAEVFVGNAAPTISNVLIDPEISWTGDALSCGYTFSDSDGDADNSTVSWSINGSVAGTGSTLSSGFVGHDDVHCTVTPYDGADYGVGVSSNTIIQNSIPSITGVILQPNPASADETLTCVWSGFYDADGEVDQTLVSWDVNGLAAGYGVSLNSGYLGGDTVTCTATPSDGWEDGISASSSVIIGNTAPSVSSVTISPSPAVESDVLTCNWVFVDPDNGDDNSTVSWSINGVAAGAGTTLASGFSAVDEVSCTVVPSDGIENGVEMTSAITINSPPTIDTVTITPDPAYASSVLRCDWDGYNDVDGDPETSTKFWLVNGVPSGGGMSIGGLTRDDTVVCEVTPSDPYSSGLVVSSSLTISNSAPSVMGAMISPANPAPGETLTCNWGGFADADGDADQSTVRWLVDDVEAGTDPTLVGGFTGNAEIVCEVTPFDGTDSGTAVLAVTTSTNTPPYMTGLGLSPIAPTTNEDIIAISSGSDDDGDDVVFEYTWFVNYIVVAEASDTLPSSETSVDDIIYVSVRPYDGAEYGSSISSFAISVQK